MKAQLRTWNIALLVAAIAVGCANSRGMKLPFVEGGAGAQASSDAGMPSVPVSSGGAGVQSVPVASVDASVANAPVSSGAVGTQAAPDAGPAGSLMITFTTVTNGRYAPHNAGAAWIETSSGVFVKTLERWAGIEANRLQRWTMASGGWGNLFAMNPNPGDMMDVISRATLRKHETHELTWNLKETHGAVVPDGPYQVVIEVVDSNDGSISSVVPFQKGRQPLTVMPRDMPPFTGFELVYQP